MFMPNQNEDARRQEFFARQFYLIGDYLAGSNAQPRMEPGNVGGDLLGPTGAPYDVGVGGNGDVFIRGSAVSGRTTPAAAAVVPPIVWWLGAAALAWALLRRA